MTTAVDKMLLARLLGEAHALWLPLRTPGAPYWAAVWETRWLYPRRGLPWRGQGDKEQAGALAALAAAGLARRARGKAKTVGVILTREGILRGGELVGFGPHEAECFTAELLKHGPAGCWVPEIALNGGHGWGDGRQGELEHVEHTALQALALEYAESNCDIHGRVGYRVTPAGVVAVQAWDGSLPEPPEPEPEAVAAYQDGFAGGLARLQALPALAREIGEIPLAVATWADGG
jgi:hypothetical protein